MVQRPRGSRVSRVLGSLATLAIMVAVVNAGESGESEENATRTLAENEAMEARWSEGEISVAMERKIGPLARGRDSYLEALRHSRTSSDPREGVVAVDGVGTGATGSFQRRKEQAQGPVYAGKRTESIDRDSYSMVPSDSYALPSKSYGPPYQQYSSYGDHHHGGTLAAYSPPQQAYGSPAPAYYGSPYGATESVHLGFPSIGLSWPSLGFKLNAFTLAKILLKLVIFKMIVKFIAVICLLLFIPKLCGCVSFLREPSVWRKHSRLTRTIEVDQGGGAAGGQGNDDYDKW